MVLVSARDFGDWARYLPRKPRRRFTNKGDHDRALAGYNEAIRVDPKSALAFSDRGVAYANKGDYDKALAHIEKWLSRGCYFRSGSLEVAI